MTFEDDRDARDALNDAGGRDLDGAAIKVNIAHGPAAMGFAGGRGRGRCEAAQQPLRALPLPSAAGVLVRTPGCVGSSSALQVSWGVAGAACCLL